MIPSLRTERLSLRAFRDSDLDAYARMCADAEVMPNAKDVILKHIAAVNALVNKVQ